MMMMHRSLLFVTEPDMYEPLLLCFFGIAEEEGEDQ